MVDRLKQSQTARFYTEELKAAIWPTAHIDNNDRDSDKNEAKATEKHIWF